MIRLAVMSIASGAGLAQGSVEPDHKSFEICTKRHSSHPHDAPDMLAVLEGEWEGSIQTRNNEGMTSSSIVSASCRREQSNTRLACCYEGFAFGKPTEGAMALTAPSDRASPASALYYDGATMKASGSFDRGAMSFRIERTDHGKTTRYEQVVTTSDTDHFTLELFKLDPSNRKTPAFKLEMTRMEHGEKSSAAESFEKSKPLASARAAVAQTVQRAGVEDAR